jgi:hypothetical protein
MPGPITPGSGASFDSIAPSTPAEDDSEVVVEITSPDEGDSVEISSESESEAPVYGPTNFSDRFKFDIENGMFDATLRFDATQPRARGASVEAYSERRAVEFQVTQAAGTGSPSSALFALQFQDANPNGGGASSQVDGRVAFKRMAQQNLNLLANL